MGLGFNWIDLLIIGGLTVFAIDALGRSLVLEVLDLISFLLALIFSFTFYNFPAKFFENQFSLPHGLSLVLGFMIAWFLTETMFFIIVRSLLPKIRTKRILSEDYLAVIPAILRGLIFTSFILVLIATFPVQPKLKRAVQESQVGSVILKNAYRLEQPVKNVFGGITQETLTFLTVRPKTTDKINLGFEAPDFVLDSETEASMINLVNKERTQRGLNTLTFDSKLQQVSRAQSEDMMKRGYFSHFSPEGEDVSDRAERFGVKYFVIGENLAYAPNLELAHQGLMASEGHRENILSPEFNKIGIGVVDGGIYGKMFTQVFTD